ncbi:MAG: phosphatidylglycerophosphatase A [Sphingobacteriia bacterium]|nr:phosphatidylglycerophosphatase A [Sphingobacteriia bacterium]
MADFYDKCIKLLESRGVTLDDIADAARYLQQNYHINLKSAELMESVRSVLEKREVQFAIMTAVELDRQAESGQMFDKDLEDLLKRDEGLYGVDEVLAYGICNLYGSIGLTNFGFIDKEKYGIIARLNEEGKEGSAACNTFVDDIVGAIAAAAASRFAHRWKK